MLSGECGVETAETGDSQVAMHERQLVTRRQEPSADAVHTVIRT